MPNASLKMIFQLSCRSVNLKNRANNTITETEPQNKSAHVSIPGHPYLVIHNPTALEKYTNSDSSLDGYCWLSSKLAKSKLYEII